MVTVRSEYK